MVSVGDVPVQTGHQLVVALISGEAGPAASIVTILVPYIIGNGLQILVRCTRNVVVGICFAILRTSPTVHDRRNLDHFTVHEEEQLVLDDRTTKGETVGSGLRLLTGTCNLLTLNSITLHVLILVVDVGTSLEGVRTRLGNGVHTTTNEVGLTNIIRRNHNLKFLNGIDRNRVSTTRQV